MTHPLIPDILKLASPLAATLGLEIVSAVFQTNRKPPVLRLDVRNLTQDTGLDDCERFSRALEPVLESQDVIPGSYVLEVSSPGTSRSLESDREFVAFKGFAVLVKTFAPFKEQKIWQGRLQGRDEAAVYLNCKGREVQIPRDLVAKVQLDDSA